MTTPPPPPPSSGDRSSSQNGGGSKKEKSRYAAQVVVYEMRQGEWSSEEGEEAPWAEMHLFSRNNESAFRLVAWVTSTEKIILNLKLKKKMTFALTGKDFGELRGADRVFGMYFASETQATETRDAVSGALDELKNPAKKKSLASFKAIENAVAKENESEFASEAFVAAEDAEDDKADAADEKNKGGEDDEGAAPSSSREEGEQQQQEQEEERVVVEPIDCVSDFRHDTHVVFNVEKSRYEGLPSGWTHVNKQFGVDLEKVPRSSTRKVPTVLLMLEEALKSLDAYSVVGVFRIAPDGDDCAAAKEAIDSGDKWEDDFKDVHVVATLVKQFFRDLPNGLLNYLEDDNIQRVAKIASGASTEDPEKVIPGLLDSHLDDLHKPLCLWLLDLMADVVLNSEINKMTSKNMAIVMSPNLYSTNLNSNPMDAIKMAQKVADCTNALLDWRLRHHREGQSSTTNDDDPDQEDDDDDAAAGD